jgi:hypothetical protein
MSVAESKVAFYRYLVPIANCFSEDKIIIDMLNSPCCRQLLFEKIERYKCHTSDLSKLYDIAAHYGVVDKLNKALEEFDEWIDSFYEFN